MEKIKKDYNALMEQMIHSFVKKQKLLLHSCCAPCSSSVIARLREYFDITVLYYNPNIEPEEEYRKRKQEQIRFLKECHPTVSIMEISYDHESFLKISKHLEKEKEGGARCHKCYYLRLEKTMQVAKENNFSYFGTTLTVSPYKNAEMINTIGLFLEKQQDKENFVSFLFSDFKKKDGYKKSILYSQEYQLYRQDYCGCFYGKEGK